MSDKQTYVAPSSVDTVFRYFNGFPNSLRRTEVQATDLYLVVHFFGDGVTHAMHKQSGNFPTKPTSLIDLVMVCGVSQHSFKD